MAENAMIDAMEHFGVDYLEELISVLEEQLAEGQCEATDGCVVEPDGHCQHGEPSWLLKMGMI